MAGSDPDGRYHRQGGLELVKEESPDLVLLRPDFPDKSLSEVIRELREFSDVPLVVLNHQSNDLEPVTALEAGADEYIQLPCELSEITFKIWSLIRQTERRKAGEAGKPLVDGDVKVDPSTHEVFLQGRKVSLTPAEFQLTHLLVKNNGAVVSRAEIEKELARAGFGTTGSVKQHIMRLRRKFNDSAKNPSGSLMSRALATASSVGRKMEGRKTVT